MDSFELQIFIMKQTFYSALLAIPLFFIQCSKSKTVDNNLPQPGTDPFANCLVTETNRDGFQPHYFNYDAQKRLVRHQYSDYENKKGQLFSTKRKIIVAEKTRLEIKMDYKQYDFDGEISFPFSVPKNYQKL